MIQKAIKGSYHLSQVYQESVDIVLSLLACEIRSLDKMIKELDQAIEAMVDVIPEYQCLTSVPGIIAEIDQIERFEDHPQVVKYAGLN